MNDMIGCPEDIAGFRSHQAPSSVAVPAAQDCGPRPTPGDERRFDGTRTGVLSVTLDPESIAGDEAFTSKTRSWGGFVIQNLGDARTVSDGRIAVDRDINGAWGIMLRALYGNLGGFSGGGRRCCARCGINKVCR